MESMMSDAEGMSGNGQAGRGGRKEATCTSDFRTRLAAQSLLDMLGAWPVRRPLDAQELPIGTLSRLLWRACPPAGAGGRQDRGDDGVDVYVATASGVYRLDHSATVLRSLSTRDVRLRTCTPGAAAAPVELIYVCAAHGEEVHGPPVLGAIGTALRFLNVCRFCAVEGLEAAASARTDRRGLAEAAGLGQHERIVLVQLVGFPSCDLA